MPLKKIKFIKNYFFNKVVFRVNDIELIDAYRQAAVKGILKVMNKIGISTLHSYRGAQINEA